MITALCMGCGSHVPEDDIKAVQQTLAEADSLRGMGIIMGMPFRDTKDSCSVENPDRCSVENKDSLRLAEAVAVLYPWRRVYADEYAKANYYYGRLLRAKDHYPEAMQCFIHAIHSRSRDYHILGRVYSNIGDIYRDIEDYPTAFSIYQKTSHLFLRGGDTIGHCYALTNMAWQKIAMLNRDLSLPYLFDTIENQNQARALLDSVAVLCRDKSVDIYRLETTATLYYYMQQYDSARCIIDSLCGIGDSMLYVKSLKARIFAKCQNDSAYHYAKHILSMSNDLAYQTSMLYILSHDTIHYNTSEIIQLASKRYDIQKTLEVERGNKTKATDMFTYQSLQDSKQHRFFTWVAIIGCFLTIVIVCYILRRNKQQNLLVYINRKIRNKKQEYNNLKYLHNNLHESTALLQQELVHQLEERSEMLCSLSTEQFIATLNWRNYEAMCRYVDIQLYGFVSELRHRFPSLSEQNIRLCVLLFINIPKQGIAELLFCSPNSIGKMKERISKKIGTQSSNLHDFLWGMMLKRHVDKILG